MTTFAQVGPIDPSGNVEVPLGSGRWYPSDGMLSAHPDGPAVVLALVGRDLEMRDVPLVLDHWAPLGLLMHCGAVGFVQRRGMKIDRVLVMPVDAWEPVFPPPHLIPADAKITPPTTIGTLEGMGPWLPRKGPIVTGLGDDDPTPVAPAPPLRDAPLCYLCNRPTLPTGELPLVCSRCREIL